MYNVNQEKTHYNKSSTKFRDSRLTVYILSQDDENNNHLFPLLISSILYEIAFFLFLREIISIIYLRE